MKTFTENDIYVVTFLDKIEGKPNHRDEFSIVVIGEIEAHKHFNMSKQHHDKVILSKGKVIEYLNNCIVADEQIDEWYRR